MPNNFDTSLQNISNKNKKIYSKVKSYFNRILQREQLSDVFQVLFAIFIAMMVGSLFILVIGENPIQAYSALLKGAFGSGPAIARSLRVASPLILAGLAVSLAFRAGVINLGIEGSLYLGALAAALAGIYLKGLPLIIHLPISLLSGAIIGGLWAFFPGILKSKLGVDEVVASLMLNYVAILLVDFLVLEYFMDPIIGTTSDRPATLPILQSAKLPYINETYGLTISIIIGVAIAIILALIFKRSIWGFELDMTGFNKRFAHFGGVNISKLSVWVMIFSGMLGGLAGATESLGVYGRYVSGFSTGIGFDGVAVALMGRLNPIGTVISAIFFGGLKNGGVSMEMAVNVPRDIILIIEGMILAIVTVTHLLSIFRSKKSNKMETK